MSMRFKRFRLRQLVKDEVVEYLMNGGSRDGGVALPELEAVSYTHLTLPTSG